MRERERVGVLGATGGAGRTAVAELLRRGVTVRAASRSRERAADVVAASESGTRAEAASVDVTDPMGLAAFCADCRLVVDCSGPAADLSDRAARAAASAGADYIAAAGDEPFRVLLDGIGRPSSWTAVVSAGMMPGLTGLLPRRLAAEPGAAAGGHLTAYVGGRDRFTPAAAADYLAGLGEEVGLPGAAWRRGRVRRALRVRTGVSLPFFLGPVTAQPYLSAETERTARTIGLDAVDWYSVFDGTAVLDVLTAAGGAPARRPDAAALMRAAELDLFGRTPYQVIVLRIDAAASESPDCAGLVLKGTGASALTGTTAALAAVAALSGEVPPGVHHAAEVLDAERFTERLPDAPAVTLLEAVAGPALAAANDPTSAVEEGLL